MLSYLNRTAAHRLACVLMQGLSFANRAGVRIGAGLLLGRARRARLHELFIVDHHGSRVGPASFATAHGFPVTVSAEQGRHWVGVRPRIARQPIFCVIAEHTDDEVLH